MEEEEEEGPGVEAKVEGEEAEFVIVAVIILTMSISRWSWSGWASVGGVGRRAPLVGLLVMVVAVMMVSFSLSVDPVLLAGEAAAAVSGMTVSAFEGVVFIFASYMCMLVVCGGCLMKLFCCPCVSNLGWRENPSNRRH